MEASQTDSFHSELLASLEASGATTAPDAYRIERALKESDFEKTQLVYIRTLDGGELGPYVRKLIDKQAGLGGTYRLLMDAQLKGKRLQHIPRIVRLNEGEEVDGGQTLEVVMEYVNGPSVREIVEIGAREQGHTTAGRLLPSVCDAVSELHEQLGSPVIHRDLTPSNIICPEGNLQNPVLIDFAISRAWSPEAESDTTHFGTRAYAPPEQFGFGQTDVRSDIYALGMLAFFCLTGRDPHPADRTVSFYDLDIPEPWRRVIEKACELDPAKRYENVRQLRRACEEAASECGSAHIAQVTARMREGAAAAQAPERELEQTSTTYEKCDSESGFDNVAQTRNDDGADAAPRETTDSRVVPTFAGIESNPSANQSAANVATASPNKSHTSDPAPSKNAESGSAQLTKAKDNPSRPEKRPRFFTFRNILVLAGCAIFIAACVYDFFDPSLNIRASFATNLFSFLIWGPSIMLTIGFVFLDKRWLFANVPWFKERTRGRVWRDAFLALLVTTLMWLAVIAIWD